ncbi:MAG TPA: DUF4178 domain-containing protein [Vicinamibacteria bacterium]|nr:DUF4178 domain-containing protein [Vicinamibacteria bacterium]
MSGYRASCPSCGGEVVFALGTSLLRVCDHCGTAVARQGANVANYGKVAELIPTPSVLALGMEGDYEGAPPFRLVGRLQLDWGQGTWDEWLLGFSDESWAWLAESQGRFHYMGQAALPPVPAFEDLVVGQTVDLGAPGTFVVAEVRSARFAAAQGELPFAVAPGTELHYADLSGPGGQLATLDYGSGGTAEALYVGRETSLPDLGLRPREDAERRKAVGGETLKCPQCAGPLEVRAPDQTQRVGCPWCGSLLDATRDLAILEALAKPPLRPLIPLGAKGRLDGVQWTVIGVMERSVTVEGIRYPWTEYLLYEPRRGFRWLVEAKRHWSFVQPLNPGDVAGGPRYEGERFAHFQSGQARVDHVLGEFYWTLARGETVETDDHVKPPRMLSRERTRDATPGQGKGKGKPGKKADTGELTWSLGSYLPPDELWTAFSLPGRPPEPEGVAPHQPSPWAGTLGSLWTRALLAVAAIFVVFVALSIVGGRTLHRETVVIPQGATPGSGQAAMFAGPFFVTADGNLQVKVQAPVSNSWLYLDGALVNEETGAVDPFDMEVAYYFGSDSDGSWSEGGTTSTRYIPSVPPGRYLLRLEPQWEPGRPAPDYQLTVRSRVPRFLYALVAMLAVIAWPAIASWRWFRFEVQRWSESDHPWITSEE